MTEKTASRTEWERDQDKVLEWFLNLSKDAQRKQLQHTGILDSKGKLSKTFGGTGEATREEPSYT